MTLEEMRIDYREAKDKKAQIPIIADQALMTPWEVSVLLHDAGEDVDMRWYAQKKNWKKEEPPKPAMKMKGGPYSKDDDVEKYLPQQDDDEPGALEGVAALIAFLGTGFATYQLVMNFLQQIQ